MGKEKMKKKAHNNQPNQPHPRPSTASPPTPLRMERGVESTVCWGGWKGITPYII